MISLNSFRVALFKIQMHDVHQTSILAKSASHLVKRVIKKLGLSPKPKRPLNPFFRYMQEKRSSIVESYPTLNMMEVSAVLTKMWMKLDEKEKEKFQIEYDNERLKYMTEFIKYKQSLTDDDEKKIMEMNAKVRHRKMQLKKKNALRDLGRPKRPPNSFLNYLREHKVVPGTLTQKECTEHFKQVAAKWKTLTDDEQAKYKSTEDEEKYKKAMCEWEVEMVRQGRRDVVRQRTLVPEEALNQKTYRTSIKPKEGKSKT